MDPYQVSIDTFNDLAEQYQQKYFHLTQYHPGYDCFCEYIGTPTPDILELGCGPGNISNYLLNKRPDFRMLLTDAAPNMLELAKKNNPMSSVQVLDVRHLHSLRSKFHGIVAGFCLPYLNRRDAEAFMQNCFGLLHAGGVFYLSTMEGDYRKSGKQTGETTGRSVYTFYHNQEALLSTLQPGTYELLRLERLPFSKPDGSTDTDLIMVLKKR